ncbi:hypothetical protein D3C59_20335 [Streptomyces sp. SHP22-7]|nr:hypothetical protein D3C59_20335 [Streptomyces sp. SHP22-7]
MGLAVAAVVVVDMLAALTLLPALLTRFGERIAPPRCGRRARRAGSSPGWPASPPDGAWPSWQWWSRPCWCRRCPSPGCGSTSATRGSSRRAPRHGDCTTPWRRTSRRAPASHRSPWSSGRAPTRRRPTAPPAPARR